MLTLRNILLRKHSQDINLLQGQKTGEESALGRPLPTTNLTDLNQLYASIRELLSVLGTFAILVC